MNFFNQSYFSDYRERLKSIIKEDINSQTDNYILNINADDYAKYLVEQYRLDIPRINFNDVYVDTVERDIPKRLLNTVHFHQDDDLGMIRKQVILYNIPYQGNLDLLKYIPNPRTLSSFHAKVDSTMKIIIIEIVNLYDEAFRIKKMYEEEVRNLQSNYQHIIKNLEDFNNSLSQYINTSIENRKNEILKQKNILSSLGIPIKQSSDVSKTFSVPHPKLKERIIVKPPVAKSDFAPEPCLDSENYRRILKIINDVGKNFERLPSTYKNKSEEDIRDHILLILDPNFEMGSATGETFNAAGKTDILLRYDGSVVFIGECKFWRGEKAFLKTIDQLLSYLTWRNSKVAIINFVQNLDFTDVLTKIKHTIKLHPNFLKESEATDETWFNYKLHLNDDRNREVECAIISFHLPPKQKM